MISKECILCRHKKLHLIASRLRDSIKHKILRCKKCGHVQLYPLPSHDEDKKFYDKNLQDKNINYYGSIAENWKKSKDDTIRRTNLISKLSGKKTQILEIGSGHGFFLEMMRKKGYNITGIEISKERRGDSRKVTKAQVLDININTDLPNIGKFNIIVMFHVLEHIADPVNFLRNAKKLLTPNGKIVVEVPNYNDFQLKLHKAYRDFYWQRAHIHYFTPKILKYVFNQAGLQIDVFGVQRYSIENMFSWKLTNKPQLYAPTYYLPKPYEWIDKLYKTYLEKKLISDTIIATTT